MEILSAYEYSDLALHFPIFYYKIFSQQNVIHCHFTNRILCNRQKIKRSTSRLNIYIITMTFPVPDCKYGKRGIIRKQAKTSRRMKKYFFFFPTIFLFITMPYIQVGFFKNEAKRGQYHYFQIVYRL